MNTTNIRESAKEYAPAVARISLSLVFLWFGINQLMDPGNFIGYLPQYLFSTAFANTAVIINGTVEIILGSMLLAGIFTRVVAVLLAIHLILIVFELGYGEIAVRDFGLAMVTLSIALGGVDKLCLERKWIEQKWKNSTKK